jgi:hypothetical protein
MVDRRTWSAAVLSSAVVASALGVQASSVDDERPFAQGAGDRCDQREKPSGGLESRRPILPPILRAASSDEGGLFRRTGPD